RAPRLSRKRIILVNLSGRGDKDVESVLAYDREKAAPAGGVGGGGPNLEDFHAAAARRHQTRGGTRWGPSTTPSPAAPRRGGRPSSPSSWPAIPTSRRPRSSWTPSPRAAPT